MKEYLQLQKELADEMQTHIELSRESTAVTARQELSRKKILRLKDEIRQVERELLSDALILN